MLLYWFNLSKGPLELLEYPSSNNKTGDINPKGPQKLHWNAQMCPDKPAQTRTVAGVVVWCSYLEGRRWRTRSRAGPRRAAAATPGADVRSAGRRAAASWRSSWGRGTADGGICHSPITFPLFQSVFRVFFLFKRTLQRRANTAPAAQVAPRRSVCVCVCPHTAHCNPRQLKIAEPQAGEEGGGVCSASDMLPQPKSIKRRVTWQTCVSTVCLLERVQFRQLANWPGQSRHFDAFN